MLFVKGGTYPWQSLLELQCRRPAARTFLIQIHQSSWAIWIWTAPSLNEQQAWYGTTVIAGPLEIARHHELGKLRLWKPNRIWITLLHRLGPWKVARNAVVYLPSMIVTHLSVLIYCKGAAWLPCKKKLLPKWRSILSYEKLPVGFCNSVSKFVTLNITFQSVNSDF